MNILTRLTNLEFKEALKKTTIFTSSNLPFINPFLCSHKSIQSQQKKIHAMEEICLKFVMMS